MMTGASERDNKLKKKMSRLTSTTADSTKYEPAG